MPDMPPIPDPLVQVIGWLELLVAVVLALTFLYALWAGMQALRRLLGPRPHRAHPYGSPALQGPTPRQIRRAQRAAARRRRT